MLRLTRLVVVASALLFARTAAASMPCHLRQIEMSPPTNATNVTAPVVVSMSPATEFPNPQVLVRDGAGKQVSVPTALTVGPSGTTAVDLTAFPAPGWYSIHVRASHRQHESSRASMLPSTSGPEEFIGEVLVGRSEPAISQLWWCAGRLTVTYSEPVVFAHDPAADLEVSSASGDVLPCRNVFNGPDGGLNTGFVQRAQLQCDGGAVASVRVLSPPSSEAGVAAVFPPPGQPWDTTGWVGDGMTNFGTAPMCQIWQPSVRLQTHQNLRPADLAPSYAKCDAANSACGCTTGSGSAWGVVLVALGLFHRRRRRLWVLTAVLLGSACGSHGCGKTHGHVHFESTAPTGALVAPDGYRASTALAGLVGPTQLRFDTAGRLYILEGSPAAPKSLRIYDRELHLARALPVATPDESTGLLVIGAGETVFVASRGRIDRLDRPDVSGVAFTPWVSGLPNGLHANNGLALGPDGLVYFTVGSTCDSCQEADARSATIMRADPREAHPTPEIFARGLRNAFDLAFTTRGELLATDNGQECDGHGKAPGEAPDGCIENADRLVLVTRGADFGWPSAFLGKGHAVQGVLAELPAHSGITGFSVRPAGDGGGEEALITAWGSQQGGVERGRRVARVQLNRDASGALVAAQPVAFLGPEGLQHPIDVTTGPDGAILLLDFGGVLVRLERTTASGDAG